MGKVKAQISVSLDGYVAGPNQSEENSLGAGFELIDLVQGPEALHMTYRLNP